METDTPVGVTSENLCSKRCDELETEACGGCVYSAKSWKQPPFSILDLLFRPLSEAEEMTLWPLGSYSPMGTPFEVTVEAEASSSKMSRIIHHHIGSGGFSLRLSFKCRVW